MSGQRGEFPGELILIAGKSAAAGAVAGQSEQMVDESLTGEEEETVIWCSSCRFHEVARDPNIGFVVEMETDVGVGVVAAVVVIETGSREERRVSVRRYVVEKKDHGCRD